MRDVVGEWRGRAADLEEQLYEERRKPDERVRSQNAKALAARAAAEARAAAACAESQRLHARHVPMRNALERERQARKEADRALLEEQQRRERERERLENERVDALRQQDREWRSNNKRALEAAAAAEALEKQLERAKRLRGSAWVQEAERLEAELEEARTRAKCAYSLVTALRRNQSAAEVTRLREQLQKSEALAAEAQQLSSRATEAVEVMQEEFEKDAAAAAVVARRAAKAHSMALKRVRDAHAEVKELKLDVSREVASLRRQAEAEARFDELCARLNAGDERVLQMQHELQAGCRVQLSLSVSSGGGVRAAAGVQTNEAQLAELQADARRAVAVTMEAALPPESEKQLVEAEMARRLGSEWWLQLPITKQQSICRVWAATCNAHRWVNVGKGFDDTLQKMYTLQSAAHGAPWLLAQMP
ncbi:hypothetical protein Ctob_010524 [Chrysochromulina tobinii]|uniref:Uncharacterized protein n=1 Tax=Chrysochromulina tobinii TaxID=1460289 RepID=A0A0M0JZF5_9EUKA|nr:hypothetical protein Ctob_010524 [Chrysochromulina tobinii]|eukprot:KOO31717.1 hypothetical protein Ctob_010524 [Chrysochromulina sp. CCMP291]